MNLSVSQWHERFTQQAGWTRQLRSYLYTQIGLTNHCRVLEVGCGTGAIASDFAALGQITYVGLDLDPARLSFATATDDKSSYICGDAYQLPFPSESFDFVISHYLFLWLKDPLIALLEMLRVTRKGGSVLALAEPDYGSRIDEPSNLIPLGETQTRSLELQGANPRMGRQLPALFSHAGFKHVQFGSTGFQTQVGSLPQGITFEWRVLEQDLGGIIQQNVLDDLKELDRLAWLDGSRVLWVPTFYAMGTKSPKSHADGH